MSSAALLKADNWNFVGQVLYILPGFPSDENDLNCLPYVQDFMTLMKDKIGARQMQVITLHYPFEKRVYQWKGIQVYALGGRNRSYPGRLIIFLQALRLMRRLYVTKNVKVLHCYWLTDATFIARLFQRLHRIKIITTIIGQDPLSSNNYLRLINLNKIIRVGISRFVSDQLYISKKKKANAIIPLVLDTRNLSSLNPANESFDVLGAGNLSELKNYGLFIQTIDKVRTSFPSIRAAIAGEGEQREMLEKLIIDRSLQENIRMLGQIDRRNLHALMKNSKVFLHTSTYESQGFVIDEALYFGMKAVSTKVSDLDEGDQIKLGSDPDELAAHVSESLKNWQRQSVLLHDPDKAIIDYQNLYQT